MNMKFVGLSAGIAEAAARAGHPEACRSFWYTADSPGYFIFFPDDREQRPVRLYHDGENADFDLIYLKLMVLSP